MISIPSGINDRVNISNPPSNGELADRHDFVKGRKMLNNNAPAPGITGFRPNEAQIREIVSCIINNKRRDFLNFSARFEPHELSAILRSPIDRDGSVSQVKPENETAETSAADYWWTPIHLMAYYDRLEMMSNAVVENMLQKYLASKSPEQCHVLWDSFNRLPLSYAIERGHLGTSRFLCRCSSIPSPLKKRNSIIPGGINDPLRSRRSSILLGGNSDSTSTFALNAADIHGFAPIHYAAKFNSKGTAKDLAGILLISGADPDPVDQNGYTPLYYAVIRGNLELTQILVENGADANRCDNHGWTPLIFAAYYGFANIVEFLVTPNPAPHANLLTRTNRDATSLIVACQNGHADVVEAILATSAGVAIVNFQDESGRTALHVAAVKGQDAIVAKLLSLRANHTIVDNWGATPLHLAIVGAHPERVVPKLLESGASVETADDEGWTPLMVSADSGNLEITKSLISAAMQYSSVNSIINCQRKDGTTPLIIAAAGGHDKIVEELLLPQTAVDTARGEDDWSALFQGTYRQSAKSVRSIINHLSPSGFAALASLRLREVNKRSALTGMSPLLLASLIGNTAIARMLIDAGATVNTTDKTQFTPLMAAVQSNNEGMVRILLQKGARVDDQESSGYTALAISAFYGHSKIAEQLLTAKASPFIAQINGRSPLLLACEKGHYEIVRMLIKRHPTTFGDVDCIGRTALHYAVLSGDEKTVLALCENTTTSTLNPNAFDKYKVTALMIAASNPKRNSENKSTAAVQQSSEVSESSLGQRQIVMSVSSQASNNKISPEVAYVMPVFRMKTLEIDLRDSNGDTALMRAYLSQNWAFAEAALRRGASAAITQINYPHFTPLMIAASNGYLRGVELIKHIAPHSVNIADALGRTAIFLAVMNNHTEIVDRLLEEPAPADVNAAATGKLHKTPRDDTENDTKATKDHPKGEDIVMGTTALHYAAMYGTEEMAHRLVVGGATLDHTNEKGEHALMLAAKHLNWRVFEYLLSEGSFLGLKDNNGQTVLHRLCSLENENEAGLGFRLVVKHRGSDVLDNITDRPKGNTALHLAAMHDKPVIVDELVILGASREVLNVHQKTPADLILYGPELFEQFGKAFDFKWRDMGRVLLRKAIQKGPKHRKVSQLDPEAAKEVFENLFHEEMAQIEELPTPVSRATRVVERFYELSSHHYLEVDSIIAAWETVKGNKDEKGFISANLSRLADEARGRLIVYKADTVRNLLKIRSTIDRPGKDSARGNSARIDNNNNNINNNIS